MKNKINILCIYTTFLFLIIFTINCSSSANKPEADQSEVLQNSIKTDNQSTEEKNSEEEMEIEDGTDLGKECVNHVYVVAAGSTVSLEFHVILNKKVLMFEEYSNQKPDNENLYVKDSHNDWEKFNIFSEKPQIQVDIIETSTELWGTHAQDFIDQNSDNHGTVFSVSQTHGGKTNYRIKFFKEGIGLLDRLGRYRHEQNIAALTYDQVSELLNNSMEIKHIRGSNSYTFQIENISVDTEMYAVTLTYNITFPDDVKSDLKGCKIFQKIKEDDHIYKSYNLSIDYNKRKKQFRVKGPWETQDCSDD